MGHILELRSDFTSVKQSIDISLSNHPTTDTHQAMDIKEYLQDLNNYVTRTISQMIGIRLYVTSLEQSSDPTCGSHY